MHDDSWETLSAGRAIGVDSNPASRTSRRLEPAPTSWPQFRGFGVRVAERLREFVFLLVCMLFRWVQSQFLTFVRQAFRAYPVRQPRRAPFSMSYIPTPAKLIRSRSHERKSY